MLKRGQMGWLKGAYPPEALLKQFKIETGIDVDLVFAREFLDWAENKLRANKKKFASFCDLNKWLTNQMHEFFELQL